MKSKKYFKSASIVLIILTSTIFNISCKKFLDEKPSSSLTIISVENLQGLLDDFNTMNNNYPADGEVSSDDYFLTTSEYNSLVPYTDNQDFYLWKPTAQRYLFGGVASWYSPYKVVYNANLILETLNSAKEANSLSPEALSLLKGSALFFRGFTHFCIAQLYAKSYDLKTANRDLGIPVRTSTALEDKSLRGTVQETYEKIITDLQQAVSLLPITTSIKSRPSKAAAYAALARVYLIQEDYVNAGKMADECLKLYDVLIDYNTLDRNTSTPFIRFNNEVIFHSLMEFAAPTSIYSARIDKELYQSYSNEDLRKTIFFKPIENDHTYSGNYDPDPMLFNGLATDEIYLIRAECYARNGKTALAMADLNTLMKNRWTNTVPYPSISAASPDEALRKILTERRKELLFRGLRWPDLRRLNKDERFKKDLVRKENGTGPVIATLPANDLRYVLLINQDVVTRAVISQNPR